MKPAHAGLAATMLALLIAPAASAHGGTGLQLGIRDADPAGIGHGLAPFDAPSSFVSDEEGGYFVRFECPEGVPVGGDPEAVVDNRVCPQYVFDLEDFLGQPQLVIDPQNPHILAFHSLHGGKGLPQTLQPGPPTDRSRWNALHQPHTTFQTNDGGREFHDQRYYAFDSLDSPGRTIYGEDNVIALDGHGAGYLASLYSWRDEGQDTYHWSVVAYKTQRLNRPINYYENVNVLTDPDSDTNRVSDLQLVWVPGADAVVLLWREEAANGTVPDGAATSWITAFWTRPGEGASWTPLAEEHRVRGCQALAKPVAAEGTVYFGCRPDEGYALQPGEIPDRWQIHAIDVAAWTTRHVAPTPIATDHARLVPLGDQGHMVLVGSGVQAGEPTLPISKGSLGASWQDPTDYAEHVSPFAGEEGTRIQGARVTAAVYATQTGNLHLIYQERYDSVPGVGHLEEGQARMFNKTYAVVRPLADSFEGRFDNLGFGQALTAVDAGPVYKGLDDSLFDDLHDDLVAWTDPATGRERLFVAFGDYGAVRFAEVIEENPPFFIALPPLNVPPIPVAAPASNAALNAAAAGVITALMLLRMLVAKRKHTVEAPSL